MLDTRGFDAWAADYDRSVAEADEAGAYPFAGYEAALAYIFQSLSGGCRDVLDLGFGTGVLTARLYQAGHRIWGQDFSREMVRLAREKMPDARLFCGDFSRGLAPALKARRYDAIVATYSLHHLREDAQAPFIRELLALLREGGSLFIADVAFASRSQWEDCRRRAGARWDGEETYFVYDELKEAFPALGFAAMSPCAGVLTLKR